MGSVVMEEFPVRPLRSARLNKRRIKLGLAIFYALAIPAFIIIGLQPADISAEVRATEAAQAEEYLTISSLNFGTPVRRIELVRNTLNTPEYIAGAYHAYTNKTLIIGHMLTVFEDLHKIDLNARIDYEDGTYLVTEVKTLKKEDISMSEVLKDEDEPTIIIMTCAGEPLSGLDYTHRLIVTAKRI